MTEALALCLCLALPVGAPDRPPDDAWFGEDKFRHFAVSFALTNLLGGGARLAGMEPRQSALAGASAAALAGVAKEVYDQRQAGNRFSIPDLVWDLFGAAAGYAVVSRAR
ncbi:MAG: DUF2279 domain-containing protein [Longimicrobiaceae bacterium]